MANGSIDRTTALTAESNGLDEVAKPYRQSLLHLAVYSGELQILKYLLELRSTLLPVTVTDCFGRAPLAYAACKDAADMASLLLTHSADPNAKDRDGRTALHVASSMDHAEVMTPCRVIAEIVCNNRRDRMQSSPRSYVIIAEIVCNHRRDRM